MIKKQKKHHNRCFFYFHESCNSAIVLIIDLAIINCKSVLSPVKLILFNAFETATSVMELTEIECSESYESSKC